MCVCVMCINTPTHVHTFPDTHLRLSTPRSPIVLCLPPSVFLSPSLALLLCGSGRRRFSREKARTSSGKGRTLLGDCRFRLHAPSQLPGLFSSRSGRRPLFPPHSPCRANGQHHIPLPCLVARAPVNVPWEPWGRGHSLAGPLATACAAGPGR